MKSVFKLLRRFAGILLLSCLLLLLINFLAFAILVAKQAPRQDASPYYIAEQTGTALHKTADNSYTLSEEMAAKLSSEGIWAILIDNASLQVIWKTENVPSTIPLSYSLPDIADLSLGYLQDFPTYTGRNEAGIVVLGYPQNSFWKHTRASWNYQFIKTLPQTLLVIVLANIALILLIYMVTNMKLLKSIKPIIKGIQALSAGDSVHIPETGILSEIFVSLNHTSALLQEQQEQLRKKETARANWIAGISHDIRTPLSIVMGYAGQLESSSHLTVSEQQKASVIVAQSERIKNLISDLNLASKLEYNMQPLMKKAGNAIAIVRQVVVDFINTNIDEKFSFEWKTDSELNTCTINADSSLLKRAVSNLIQNSINHNENGCTIYVSVATDAHNCLICVEDSGVGMSDEQLERLNNAPHYMFCDINTTEQQHGLGLLIVKQIVDGHNGQTLIEHSVYGGIRVTLVIPGLL